MSATLGQIDVLERPAAAARGRTSGLSADADWPRTTRIMPWVVAAFMAMVWLIPFDRTELTSFSAPIDLKLDRIALILGGAAWLVAFAAGGSYRPRFRRSGMNWALLAFIAVAVAGVAANMGTLAWLGELDLAIKKLALLFSFLGLFFLVTTVIRPSEVPRFVVLMVGLASLNALGVIWEYRTGFNVFYSVTPKLMPPGFL